MPPRRPAIRLCSTALAALAAFALATPCARADSAEVVLRLKGGGFELTGQLRAFDGTNYILETRRQGRITLNAARYECVGEACSAAPAAATLDYERLYPERAETVAVAGPDTVVLSLLPALVRGYAAAAGMDVIPVLAAGAASASAPSLRLVDDKGARLATFELRPATASAALDALQQATAAIALADRPATPDDLRGLTAGRPRQAADRAAHVLGSDGLAVVVAHANAAQSLPLDALARILAGRTADWYELGLPPGKITVHLRDEASAAIPLLTAELLTPRGLALAPAITRHATDAGLADAVARDPHALGIVSLASVRSTRPLVLATSCGLLVRPTPFNVKAGEYPLTLPIALYAPSPPREAAARGLLRYVASREAAETIDRAGFAGTLPGLVGLDQSAERLAHATNAEREAFDLAHMRQLLADLKDWQRLSFTFRFPPGTRDNDPRTRADAERLAALLQSPELKGRRVVLAGFTDADGGKFQANLTHSLKRASAVRQALLAAGGTSLDARRVSAKGYGPLAPVACNDTADGRARNRRVEVWLSPAE